MPSNKQKLPTRKIIELIHEKGPLTGKEIHQSICTDLLSLWKACSTCGDIVLQSAAVRYLRLDRQVKGYARLSPSILREFYSYTAAGLKERPEILSEKCMQIRRGILEISKNKLELARETAYKIVGSSRDAALIRERACFMIGGDVAYKMAHLEPRPEFSTGKYVNGSDLDIVIVHNDLPAEIQESLDNAVYTQKYFLLNNPTYREEIDYVIKDIEKVREQLAFQDFKSIVACKVLEESLFLFGNTKLFREIKSMSAAQGIPQKLAALYDDALQERKTAVRQLLESGGNTNGPGAHSLFYSTDEREEFF